MSAVLTFTAAQIATALGSPRQAVQRALASVPEDGKQIVRGNEASAWRFAALPSPMQAKLARRARARGFRNAEHLLSDAPGRFESPVPISQLAAPIQQRCVKLRDALARPLAEYARGLKGAALEELGLREYERVFGFAISARHWRALFGRTIARDAGEFKWERLDLYVDDRPRRVRARVAPKTFPAILDAEKILLGYAGQVREPSAPTPEEKAQLWITAFEQTIALVESGLQLSQARKAMRRALWTCGAAMAKTEISLGEQWRVKEAKWREAEGSISALKDGRAEACGQQQAPEIPQEDIDRVIAHGVKFGGRVSQAWRHVVENRMLSPEVQFYYEGAAYASKSFVPRSIRDAVTPEVRMLRDIHHGPRTAKLNGAYINRTWDNVASGDTFQADDVTLNNYYYAPDGLGGWALMRGQVLLMIDTRSTCILGFAILDQRNYTSHVIRTLITRTCDAYGLPRKGFYFEGGIWEKSRLVKGDAKVSDHELTWTESEGGLRELGLEFRRSYQPRSKPVERVIGAIQNLLDGEPGDAGRHEMKDGFERLQWKKREVESGRVAASEYFYRHDQWEDRLAKFCEEYNTSRQDGKMTAGLTPLQAWQRFQKADDPLVKLPPVARYLLAHHKRPAKVGRNGIVLRFGNQTFTYRNAETGKLRGQQVLAWFNPELPELLAVTDMNRENCFTVERAEDLPAMDATPEELSRAMASVNAHNSYARQRYRMIAPMANLNPRPTIMDAATARLGQDIEAQKVAGMAKRDKRAARTREGAKAFSRLGYRPLGNENLTDKQLGAADELTKLLQED